MEDVEKIISAVAAIALAVASLVARYQGTDKNKSVISRLATTFDITQIFDKTRKLND